MLVVSLIGIGWGLSLSTLIHVEEQSFLTPNVVQPVFEQFNTFLHSNNISILSIKQNQTLANSTSCIRLSALNAFIDASVPSDYSPFLDDLCLSVASVSLSSFGSFLFNAFYFYDGPLNILDIDQFVHAQQLLRDTVRGILANGNDPSRTTDEQALATVDRTTRFVIGNMLFSGLLIFTPDTPSVRSIVHTLNTTYERFRDINVRIVDEEDHAVSTYAFAKTNQERVWAIITFNRIDIEYGVFDYSIRMNQTVIPATHSVISLFYRGTTSSSIDKSRFG